MSHVNSLTTGAVLMFTMAYGMSQDACAQSISFTTEQLNAGRQAYRQSCATCHGPRLEGMHPSPSLAGARFDLTWRGKTADVLAFHVRRMPPEAVAPAGSINDETYTNILAYILDSNGFEPGETALPSDMAALRMIKIPAMEGVEIDPFTPVEPTLEQAALLENLPEVTDAMLRDPPAKDWLQWGQSYNGQNFSPLDQINKKTVSGLKPAWRAPLRPGMNMATPLVHSGIMFLYTFPDTILAMDATNGMILWRYQHESRMGSSQKMGIALHGDKVLVPTSDLHVIALNAKTGEKIWDHTIETEAKGGYQIRSAPLVVGDRVIQGVTASFVSKGGFILGLDVNSGQECWRFNSIPRPGEFGDETWNNVPIERRSGGSVWHQGTYDPKLNLIYYGIAPTYDTGPLLRPVNQEGINSDALYTNCTVALNPLTGDLVWHFQHMANDQWDLDWVFERQIATLTVNGEPRKAVMNVGKMAILEAVDAATGEYLFSVDSGTQNVITAIDPKTGAKTIDPEKLPDPDRECVVCPTAAGARAWPLTSYNPRTNLVYIPITEWCMKFGKEGMRLLTSGVGISDAPHPDSEDGLMGKVQAIDVVNQKLAWKHDEVAPISTGTLATAGGLVFAGNLEPSLNAYDDATGRKLWHTKLDDGPSANIITYSVNDKQYLAVVAGINNLHVDIMARAWEVFATGLDTPRDDAPKGGASIWVFSL